jgi:hypothetical protein
MRIHKFMSCSNRAVVKPSWMLRSLIHLLSCSASASDLLLCLVFMNRSGARSFGRCPISQAEFQKAIFCPSTTVIVVHAAKRSLSFSVHGTSDPSLFRRCPFVPEPTES